jgi:gliding motility-associated-like protein
MLICIFAFCLGTERLAAQGCPNNIDFENGTFDNWTCYVGNVSAVTGSNVISLVPSGGPVPDQHTMYSRASDAGTNDFYGGFPVLCPNGSGFSAKLGNTSGGAQAEGLSYEFTIPANRNTYSLIYHYAVVFQDPRHLEFQQPRLELEVTNVTDNQLINCSSFTFFPNGSSLPGFFQSPNGDTTAVWCKDWSAVTINLNGQAGKTIRLLFKTADCTFRRHFGYAYIDVNSECSSEFVGATYCPDDTAVTLYAPFGYQGYTWFNNTFTQVLGSSQTLHYAPPPPSGTSIAVEVVPYSGYGCLDTLYAILKDTLTLKANAGADGIACNGNDVLIGSNPKLGVTYNWSPATDLSNANIANPRAGPSVTTQYILNINSTGGGCRSSDTVIVKASFVDSAMQILGKNNFCAGTSDSAVLKVQPTQTIQWFKNNAAINGITGISYRVHQAGAYYATLTNSDGCSTRTRTETIAIETPPKGVRYPLVYAVANIEADLQARTFGASVLWAPSVYLSNIGITNPLFKATEPDIEQLYLIAIKSAAGCLTTDTQLVKTIKEVKVYVPNAFTPNNDGHNDLIRPIMIGIRQLKGFKIFNRGGQLVYDMQPGHNGWDGKIGGLLQSSGVYVWLFQGLGWDKKIHTQKGTLVLIR